MSQNKQNTLVSKPGNLSNLVRAAESSNQPSPNSTCSFLVDLADIQSMKQNLQELLTSFRSNKLQSFGENDTIQQMENIRTMQVLAFSKMKTLYRFIHTFCCNNVNNFISLMNKTIN